MKNAPQVENENVIKVSFGASAQQLSQQLSRESAEEIPHHIAHPASKNYPEATSEAIPDGLEDDPLEALLNEGAALDFGDEEEEMETYIHAHQKPFQYSSSYACDASELASCAIERLGRLKEDAKRLRYYLDELNID